MDFDPVKENIQPLAVGRNVSLLQASLRNESQHELLAQRNQLEEEIKNYKGDDPLEPWYKYICWIEQCYPSGGSESGLQKVLHKCLARFENDEQYKQDRRLIKLFIKFMEKQKDPFECYLQMFNNGIGTMVADFYIAWAYSYDLCGNTRKAEEIFRRGITCRAQPLDELIEAHQHFGFSCAQRLIFTDGDEILKINEELNERRAALQSLRGTKRKGTVGSVRTGAAIKSTLPGIVTNDQEQSSTSRGRNAGRQVPVFSDENKPLEECNVAEPKTTLRSIIDAASEQENLKEPGPWHKAHDKKKHKELFPSNMHNDLAFAIHNDEQQLRKKPELAVIKNYENNLMKPFKYPDNFVPKSKKQNSWLLPVTTEEQPDPKTIPEYNKCMLYPRPNLEFSQEEWLAYRFWQKRDLNHPFVKKHQPHWSIGDINANVRRYPNFAALSKPRPKEAIDEYFQPPSPPGIQIAFDEIYNEKNQREYQVEELIAKRWREKHNETIHSIVDMEETIVLPEEKLPRRKSFFPNEPMDRKSFAPNACKRKSIIPRKNEKKEEDNSILNTKPSISKFKSILPPLPSEESPEKAIGEIASNFESNIKQLNIPRPDTEKSISPKQSNVKSIITPFLLDESLNVFAENPKEICKKTDCHSELVTTAPQQSTIRSAAPHEDKPMKCAVRDQVFIESPPSEAVIPDPTKYPTNVIISAPSSPVFVSPPKPIFDQIEIYEDSPTSKPTEGPSNFLDADETCSTHNFNIFLKTNAVSTPKAPEKLAPSRQFGTILKDIAPIPTPVITEPIQEIANIEDSSPPIRKQLSTILETSEHGTTQGTHSSGTTSCTTKSSINASPKSVLQNNLKSNVGQTPSVPRLQQILKQVPIFEDSEHEEMSRTETNIPAPIPEILSEAGNFTRLEEREDTAPAMPVIRFQEDKTETITKSVVRFQEDKTETITKMFPLKVIESSTSKPELKEQDQQHVDNYSKIDCLTAPPLPPQFSMFEDDTDTFNFFLKSPEKSKGPLKSFATKDINDTSMNRWRNQDIPDELKNPQKTFPRSQSLCKNSLAEKSEQLELTKPELNKLTDSFMADISFVPETQLSPIGNSLAKIDVSQQKQSEFKSNDPKESCINDHSFVPETQASDDFKPTNERQSFDIYLDTTIPDIQKPTTTNKPIMNAAKTREKSLDIYMDSFMHENRAMSLSKQLKTMHLSNAVGKENAPGDCLEKELSALKIRGISPLFVDEDINEMQSKKETFEQPSHLMASFMNDFSDINKKPTVTNKGAISKVPSVQYNYSQFDQMKDTSSIKFRNDVSNPQNRNGTTASKQEDGYELNAITEMFAPNISMIKNSTLLPSKWSVKNEFEAGSTSTSLSTASTKAKSTEENVNKSNFSSLEQLASSIGLKFKDSNNDTQATASSEVAATASAAPSLLASLKNYKTIEKNSIKNDFSRMDQVSSTLPIKFKDSKNVLEASTPSKAAASSSLTGEKANVCSISSVEPLTSTLPIKFKDVSSEKVPSSATSNFDVKVTEEQLPKSKDKKARIIVIEDSEDDDEPELSVYYKNTPKTPKEIQHKWYDCDLKTPENNRFVHNEYMPDQTQQIFDKNFADPNVNPFNVDLTNAFLETAEFTSYITKLPNCELLAQVKSLKNVKQIKVNADKFEITKIIGEGAYGTIYCGKHLGTGKKYAFKQERPANYWEYYICLELRSRLPTDEMIPAFMSIDYALIGNNASVLISEFLEYGSLIAVCNKIKKHTAKNIDEYIVMHLTCQLLAIFDHLHAVNIIHADVKADNLMLIKPLTNSSNDINLQLIDFGVSIDMQCFPENQTFNYVHHQNEFKCIEMRTNRPWTYQLDLFGLAGVIHVMLFGKYMEVEQRNPSSNWMPKQRYPRYFNKLVWENIFCTLLNIPHCKSMPNLQELRSLLKSELAEKEKYLANAIQEFNRALNS